MRSPLFFLLALLLVAANLRASLTGVGPLLPDIRAALGLSATAAGLLGSLPLLMFAVFAPMARLGERFGAERMAMGGLIALLAGILLRSTDGVAALFLGTGILSAAIAMTNVLMPALVKQHYPTRVPALTMAYATVMQVFASLASGIAVPLAVALPGGWRASLASVAVPVVVAMLCWLPQVRRPAAIAAESTPVERPHPPWRRALAWQVTLFMGVQSTLFYVSISWYPAYLTEQGYSATAAGTLITVYQVAALLAGIGIPVLMPRFRDQRGLAVCCASLGFVGTLGMWLAPGAAAVWVVVLGIGAGPSLILALSFIGLRTQSVQTAAALSLMAQGVGYFIAMFGPLAFGFLHDVSGGWTLPLLFVMGVATALGIMGMLAGRRVTIP